VGERAAADERAVDVEQQEDQLQTVQRPSTQEHAARGAVIRDGPQRFTHSSAPGSLRSSPPGQHRPRSMVTRRSVSSALRASIEATIEGTDGSRDGPSMATKYPIGRDSNLLEKRGAPPSERHTASRPLS
jgi:hypothetical protein